MVRLTVNVKRDGGWLGVYIYIYGLEYIIYIYIIELID